MIKHGKQFWYLYSALVILVLIRIIPFPYPASRTWGFNHLIFLPQGFTIAFFSIAAVALIIPFIKKSDIWSEKFIDWFSVTFFESPRKYYYRAIFVLLMAVLFILFSAPTHFMGDGYILINVLSDSTVISHEWNDVQMFKWSEIGAARLILILQSFFGEASKQNTILAFQIISVISGVIYIWFSFLIANIISTHKSIKMLTFVSVLFSGVMLMFFGYVEYYHFIWIFMLGHIYFSLKYIKTNKGLILSWVFLLIGIVLHLQMVLFLPSAIIAILSSQKGRTLITRYKKTYLLMMLIGTVAVLGLICYKYLTDLYIEHMFLTLYTGKLLDPNYAIFSASHLFDIANEIILVSPLLIAAVIINWSYLKWKNISRESLYFSAAVISCFLFLLLIDPQLEMPRDWDLFSMTPFPAMLLFIICLDNKIDIILKRLLITISTVLFISFLPFMITNLYASSSIKYMEYMANSKTEKSMSSLFILFGYYEDYGPKYKVDSLRPIFDQRYPIMHKRVKAGKLMNSGELDSALTILTSLKFNKYDALMQKLYSRYYYLTKDYDKASAYIENALQLRRYNADNYGDRAKIHLARGDHKKALDDLRHGYNLRNSSKFILDGLANTYFSLNQYDSTIFYAKKRVEIDSSNAKYYYMLARSYLMKQDIANAKYYTNRYAKFNLPNPADRQKLKELSDFINNLEKSKTDQ